MNTKEKYDLNTITIDELVALGISRNMAIRIIGHREHVSEFVDVSELLNLRGFGMKTYMKVEKRLYVMAKPDLIDRKKAIDELLNHNMPEAAKIIMDLKTE